jgi:hypothetical protein
VIEAALAHVAGNETTVACLRSDVFERRRLMDEWAGYVTTPPAAVVSLPTAA